MKKLPLLALIGVLLIAGGAAYGESVGASEETHKRVVSQTLYHLNHTERGEFVLASVVGAKKRLDLDSLYFNQESFKQFLFIDRYDFVKALRALRPEPGLHRLKLGTETLWVHVVAKRHRHYRLIHPRLLFGKAWGKFCLWNKMLEPLHEKLPGKCQIQAETVAGGENVTGWTTARLEQGLFFAEKNNWSAGVVGQVSGGWGRLFLVFFVGLVLGACLLLVKKWIRPPLPGGALVGEVDAAHFSSPPGWAFEAIHDKTVTFFWLSYFDDDLVFFIPSKSLDVDEIAQIFHRCAGGIHVVHGLLNFSKKKSFKIQYLSMLLMPLLREFQCKKLGLLRLNSKEQEIEYYGPFKYLPHLKSVGPTHMVQPETENQNRLLQWSSRIEAEDELELFEFGTRIRLAP